MPITCGAPATTSSLKRWSPHDPSASPAVGVSAGKLYLVPMTIAEADAFVAEHHRHHDPAERARFAVGAARHGIDKVVATAIVGNPKARLLQTGFVAEVVRLCSIEQRLPNGHASGACSFLYAACWRACRAMGFRKLITYILPEEGGATLVASGWTCIGEAGGGSWDRKERPRVDTHPTQLKMRWERA